MIISITYVFMLAIKVFQALDFVLLVFIMGITFLTLSPKNQTVQNLLSVSSSVFYSSLFGKLKNATGSFLILFINDHVVLVLLPLLLSLCSLLSKLFFNIVLQNHIHLTLVPRPVVSVYSVSTPHIDTL